MRFELKRFRRVSLFTLLAVVSAFAVWLAVISNRASRIKQAVELLSDAGCSVGYDFEYDGLRRVKMPEIPGPEFLRKIIGDEYFVDVATLSFQSRDQTVNSDLDPMRMLPNVRRIDLDYTTISNLDAIENLRELRWLDLEETAIEDQALESLANLMKLEILVLTRTRITDSGISRLSHLTNLDELRLNETSVSDACLVHLEGLAKLRNLEMCDTSVTDSGVAELQRKLPNCEILWGDDSH